MALVDQGIDGEADQFEFHKEVCIPASTAVGSVVAALHEVPVNARASVESYMSKFVGPLMGLDAGTPATEVIDVLVGEMGIETVLEDGKYATYFDATFGKALPTAESGAETILDAWVTDAVV